MFRKIKINGGLGYPNPPFSISPPCQLVPLSRPVAVSAVGWGSSRTNKQGSYQPPSPDSPQARSMRSPAKLAIVRRTREGSAAIQPCSQPLSQHHSANSSRITAPKIVIAGRKCRSGLFVLGYMLVSPLMLILYSCMQKNYSRLK